MTRKKHFLPVLLYFDTKKVHGIRMNEGSSSGCVFYSSKNILFHLTSTRG